MLVSMLAEGICAYKWDLNDPFFHIQIIKKKLIKIEEYNKFFEQNLADKFVVNNLQLIHTAKWKFDYIISRKKRNE